MASFKVERAGEIIIEFTEGGERARSAWAAYMHVYAIRKNSDSDEWDIGIDDEGKRWVQVGYVLLPEEKVS